METVYTNSHYLDAVEFCLIIKNELNTHTQEETYKEIRKNKKKWQQKWSQS